MNGTVTYNLTLQADGNLVGYREVNGKPRTACWASGTDGKPAHHATYRQGGNFVMYGSDNKVYWASDTLGWGGTTVSINNDGSFWVGTKQISGPC